MREDVTNAKKKIETKSKGNTSDGAIKTQWGGRGRGGQTCHVTAVYPQAALWASSPRRPIMKHPPLTAGVAAVVAKIETVHRRLRQPGVLVVPRGGVGRENKTPPPPKNRKGFQHLWLTF